MKYACVTNNLLDLWAEARFESERRSQLFFGEVLKVEEQQEGFCRVIQTDDYSGWVDRRFLSEISNVDYQEHIANVSSFVNAPTATVYDAKTRHPTPPYLLYYGTRLRVVPVAANWQVSRRPSLQKQKGQTYGADFAQVLLANGNSLLVKTRTIRPIIKKNREAVTGLKLVNEAKRFLGVPYLWGGVTVTGFDCSGLVRTVFSKFGIYLPRDTKDQISVGERIERDCIKTGDLLFFTRHVGLAVGPTHIIHASRGGGGVRLESLQPGFADYREDLDRDFGQARRMTS
jgi:cell wall-associated NlpC family hydrolase